MKKVLGIGNALVDLIVHIEDDRFLDEFGLEKGSMTLVDHQKMNAILEKVVSLNLNIVKSSGGSGANTIHGFSQLGGKAGYIGKIGNDDYGSFFRQYMEANNICATLFTGKADSGKSVVLVSKDSERTFATYLGAAVELQAEDLTPEPFQGYDYFHLEGYLVQNYALVERAVQLARDAKCQISIDLASFNIVRANYDFLHSIVDRYVDIIFANGEEAREYTGKNDPEEALDCLVSNSECTNCKIAVVKIGKDGALVKEKNKKHKIDPIPVRCIDTTGAGDLYASGFFYSLASGQPVDICGKIGAIVAGKIIEVIGAKMGTESWNEVKRMIGAIV